MRKSTSISRRPETYFGMQGIRIFKFFVRISSVHNDLAEKCVDLFQLYYILTRLRLWSIIFVNTKLGRFYLKTDCTTPFLKTKKNVFKASQFYGNISGHQNSFFSRGVHISQLKRQSPPSILIFQKIGEEEEAPPVQLNEY